MGYSAQSLGRWASFTPTFTGYSVQPTGVDASSSIIAPKIGLFRWEMASTGGTSNSTALTMTMPFLARSQTRYIVMGLNAGTFTAFEAYTAAGSNIISLFTLAGGVLTASGAKGCWGSIIVEIQ